MESQKFLIKALIFTFKSRVYLTQNDEKIIKIYIDVFLNKAMKVKSKFPHLLFELFRNPYFYPYIVKNNKDQYYLTLSMRDVSIYLYKGDEYLDKFVYNYRWNVFEGLDKFMKENSYQKKEEILVIDSEKTKDRMTIHYEDFYLRLVTSPKYE